MLRHDQLRDALALAREHDADTVRLEEYTPSVPPFGRMADSVEFEGEVFAVTTEELGS